MKLAPKQRPLANEVVRTATHGIFRLDNLAKNFGAYPSVARVYKSLDPANNAWLPAEMTLVMITALIKLPAT